MKLKPIIGILLIFFLSAGFVNATSHQGILVSVKSSLDPGQIIQIVKEQPSRLYFTLGKLYFDLGNLDKAKYFFTKVTELDKNFAPAYHNLGVISHLNGDVPKAIDYFKKSVEFDNTYDQGFYSLGIISFESMDFKNAITFFSAAQKLKEKNPNYNYDLAQAFVAKFRLDQDNSNEDYNDLESALYYLQKAYALNKDLPNIEKNMDIISKIIEKRNELINEIYS